MSRPRTYKTQGIVLRQSPLGEADRIITLYTPDMGKLRAVARGVRRTKSRLGGHVEPLTHLTVAVAEGKTLDAITEAETIHSFRGLREDLGRVSQAVYLAELVDGFAVEQSPNPEVFSLLLGTLGRLQTVDDPSLLMRHFEMRLLGHSGFAPYLRRCVECRTVLEPGGYVYSSARGGILCDECRVTSSESLISLSVNAIKVLRFLGREPYDQVAGLNVPSALMDEVERLLRTFIRYLLERDVRSAEFMNLVTSSPKGR